MRIPVTLFVLPVVSWTGGEVNDVVMFFRSGAVLSDWRVRTW